ncbi:YMGG-like glycine zipper-containing protein [uncultured Thiohalocapsa sp.]|uniref:YMGG-like glycine zipper-containing protein n=1 Tax=uncultured Thiohalocapsa sp. TaxID=768990 RepID=UPI0025DBBD41|nr:YMGG-like glycine zipper-containing protein [uncultured Thiohalocapsa sp.]
MTLGLPAPAGSRHRYVYEDDEGKTMKRAKLLNAPAPAILPTSLLIAALGGLSGCVSTLPSGTPEATPASYTPAERKLRSESEQFAKTSMQGCLAGAAAGALIGALAGGDSGRNALIGAAGGCAAGFAVNAYVQNKRSEYSDTEARINAMIADVRADNDNISGLINITRDVIAEDKERIAAVNAKIRSNEISAAQARTELARVRENRRVLGETIGGIKDKQAGYAEAAKVERGAGADTTKLDAEIRELKGKVATLEAEAELIDQEIAASPVAA